MEFSPKLFQILAHFSKSGRVNSGWRGVNFILQVGIFSSFSLGLALKNTFSSFPSGQRNSKGALLDSESLGTVLEENVVEMKDISCSSGLAAMMLMCPIMINNGQSVTSQHCRLKALGHSLIVTEFRTERSIVEVRGAWGTGKETHGAYRTHQHKAYTPRTNDLPCYFYKRLYASGLFREDKTTAKHGLGYVMRMTSRHACARA